MFNHKFYLSMCDAARALIHALGDYRSPGHGTYTYMVRRVLSDVLPDYVVLTKQQLEQVIAERNLFSLQDELKAEAMAGCHH